MEAYIKSPRLVIPLHWIKNPPVNRSGTKSAILWKQFELNFFGSIWVIETQKIWFREKIFKKCRIIFWLIFVVLQVNCS